MKFTLLLTKRQGDMIAHAKELPEADDTVEWMNAKLCHFLDSIAHRVFIVGCHHDSNL